MFWTNFNLQYLRMLQHKFMPFVPNGFERKILRELFFILPCKTSPPPHGGSIPPLGWFNKPVSTLQKEASTLFLTDYFWESNLKKILNILLCKTSPPIVDPTFLRGLWIEQPLIYPFRKCFHTSLNFSGWLTLNKIFERFSLYFLS